MPTNLSPLDWWTAVHAVVGFTIGGYFTRLKAHPAVIVLGVLAAFALWEASEMAAGGIGGQESALNIFVDVVAGGVGAFMAWVLVRRLER